MITTAANVNDVTQTWPWSTPSRPSPAAWASPRKRPDALLGDKGHDSQAVRRVSRHRGVLPVISRRGHPRIHGPGKLRYVVEQTSALLHQFKRLAVRWERHLDLHDALVSPGCTLICRRHLKKATT